MAKERVLFTDGEGPIVYKDLAFDLMARIIFSLAGREISGKKFYEPVSFYDDYCTEIGMEGYQAGDTLALIVPHFLVHGITDNDVREESKTAGVVKGVEEYIKGLKEDSWNIRIISTAYRPMWDLIGDYLGIPPEHIACTELDLDNLGRRWNSRNFRLTVEGMEQEVLAMLPLVRQAINEVENGKSIIDVLKEEKYTTWRKIMDQFYWKTLPNLGYKPFEVVPVVGGRRKIEHAIRFAKELGIPLSSVAYVGDSITDSALFRYLKKEGGLPIAVNANQYALRDATIAVATQDMRHLRPILDSWHQNGLEGVKNFVESSTTLLRKRKEGDSTREVPSEVVYEIVDLNNKQEFQETLETHKEFRKAVRGAAAAIG